MNATYVIVPAFVFSWLVISSFRIAILSLSIRHRICDCKLCLHEWGLSTVGFQLGDLSASLCRSFLSVWSVSSVQHASVHYCPTEPVVMETSKMVATGHMWLLATNNVATVSKKHKVLILFNVA